MFGGGDGDLNTSLCGALIVGLSLVSLGWTEFVFSRFIIGYKLGPGVLNFDFGGSLNLKLVVNMIFSWVEEKTYGRPGKVNLFFSSSGKIDLPIEG